MGKVKNLLPDQPEEGIPCPLDDCTGVLELEEVVNCTCHINPPCGSCVDRVISVVYATKCFISG